MVSLDDNGLMPEPGKYRCSNDTPAHGSGKSVRAQPWLLILTIRLSFHLYSLCLCLLPILTTEFVEVAVRGQFPFLVLHLQVVSEVCSCNEQMFHESNSGHVLNWSHL